MIQLNRTLFSNKIYLCLEFLFLLFCISREKKIENENNTCLYKDGQIFHLITEKNKMDDEALVGLWTFIFAYRNEYKNTIEKLLVAFHWYMVIEKKMKIKLNQQVEKQI